MCVCVCFIYSTVDVFSIHLQQMQKRSRCKQSRACAWSCYKKSSSSKAAGCILLAAFDKAFHLWPVGMCTEGCHRQTSCFTVNLNLRNCLHASTSANLKAKLICSTLLASVKILTVCLSQIAAKSNGRRNKSWFRHWLQWRSEAWHRGSGGRYSRHVGAQPCIALMVHMNWQVHLW